MDLGQYINLFRKWLWLLALGGALAGSAAFLVVGRRPVVYEARALISVGGYIQSPDPDATDIQSGIDLAQTYAVLVTTNDVLQAAIDTISFPSSPADMSENVAADVMPETSILEIKVTYTDPALAAGLANEIAQQLILISPTDPRLAQSSRRSVQSNYLKVVQWASTPDTPSSLNPVVIVILGVMLGVVTAAGGLVLWEFLDTTIRLPEEVKILLDLPVLSAIPKYERLSKEDPHTLIQYTGLVGPIVERFRALRAFLLYGEDQYKKSAFIVTSPSPGDGKSFTASNLAIAIAAAEKRVLLIDADLRRPILHEVFQLKNNLGLTNLLSLEPPTLSEGKRSSSDIADLDRYFQETEYTGLKVITSGPCPPNPAELLSSEMMEQWFHALLELCDFDVIIFDTPPALVASDSYVLTMTVGGSLVLVLRSGKTLQAEVIDFRQIVDRLDLNVKGVVLNGVPARDLMPYSRKYASYYVDNSTDVDDKEQKPATTPKLLQSIEHLRQASAKRR